LFYNKPDYKKNRYLLQDKDILISSRRTIFKIAIYYKDGNCKTIPSGFLTCIKVKSCLGYFPNYVAACLKHQESSIISRKTKSLKETNNRNPKIQLKLTDMTTKGKKQYLLHQCPPPYSTTTKPSPHGVILREKTKSYSRRVHN
jgi:hypothetical protein